MHEVTCCHHTPAAALLWGAEWGRHDAPQSQGQQHSPGTDPNQDTLLSQDTTRDGAGPVQPTMGKLQVRSVSPRAFAPVIAKDWTACLSLQDAKLSARMQHCHPLPLPRTLPQGTTCRHAPGASLPRLSQLPTHQILWSHTGPFLLPGGATPWQLQYCWGFFLEKEQNKMYDRITDSRSSIKCKFAFPISQYVSAELQAWCKPWALSFGWLCTELDHWATQDKTTLAVSSSQIASNRTYHTVS